MLKEEVKQMIDKLPYDCSLEDIQYSLYVRAKITKGLKDAKEGNILSHEEAEKRIKKWLEI